MVVLVFFEQVQVLHCGLTDSSLIWMGELIARVNEKTQNNGEGEEEEQMLQIEKSISLCFYL
jgi:hypothetical protein